MIDIGLQLDLAARLLIAATLGAAVGFEREVHGHPAGMRTHLLVSLGSALFTVLSITGFPPGEGAPLDPSRVAAQIVSGIGFLGAGAIIKDGFSVRGLTTAASLWATAAVGMSAGAANHVLAVVGAAIILFSLWPLNLLADRVHGIGKEITELRLSLRKLGLLAEVASVLTDHGVEIVRVQTERLETGFQAQVAIRRRGSANLEGALARIDSLEGVALLDAADDDRA